MRWQYTRVHLQHFCNQTTMSCIFEQEFLVIYLNITLLDACNLPSGMYRQYCNILR